MNIPTDRKIVIIGGGIVGLATAYQITNRLPNLVPIVLEKEPDVGMHQSGHNSGVLHSGIYYKPGSLKATNCREGKRMMEQFCQENGVPYEICGKVIVAVDDEEVPRLKTIFERGQQNGVVCRWIGPDELRELEPHASGVQAIHVPEAGIADFHGVCHVLRRLVEQRGGTIELNKRVTQIQRRADAVVIRTRDGHEYAGRFLINCAGLYSDRVARLAGDPPPVQIVPFRGEYYELHPDARHLVKNLIYPVPNPQFPFLGVHFTRMVDGTVECGPNAVWAWAREGYSKTRLNLRDMFEDLRYVGFRRLCARYWREGWEELRRSFSKRLFHAALQRLVPELRIDQLVPGRSGVRAQAVSPDGSLVDDFLIVDAERAMHVCNAPSPAATSSLRIGLTIVERLEKRLA
ncbi:MAG: hydroxyglutarate oxidase [Pirellulaceae bacterium]|nr:MAG: hydroxyglutarate oxidase [Pirellulaceae bacterium]